MNNKQSTNSLEEFLNVLGEHEIKTFSKFVCIRSQKAFTEEKFTPNENTKIHWNGAVPHINIGCRVYACHQGKDKNLYQKKRYAEKRDSKACRDHDFTERRKLAQPTKKLDCPVVINVYRVLALPRFKGHGIQHYANGDKYDGLWKKGKRHGKGRMRYEDGSIYEGNWKKDMRSGKGSITYANGSVYSGQWHQDMKWGQGMLTQKTRDAYEGTWKNDEKHGEGTYFSQTRGTELKGIWLQDIPRCGTLEEVDRDAATNPMKYDIPECTLKEPESVVEDARRFYLEKLLMGPYMK